jgi:hypothetical protein
VDVTNFLVTKLPTGSSTPGAPPNQRLELAGAATAFCLCAKEQSMNQTTVRCTKGRRARSSSASR